MVNSMRALIAIFKREYCSFFRSSLAYVFLIAFLLCSSIATFQFAQWYELKEASLQIFFSFHPYIYLFFIPAVGMRMWSEEEREGTLELLLTLPANAWQVVIAKFLAAWLFVGTTLLFTLPLVFTVCYLGDPDLGVIFAGYLASFFLAGMGLALCGFCSALTSTQVTSYISGFFILLLFMVGGMPSLGVQKFLENRLPDNVVENIVFFSITPHVEGLFRGIFDLRDIVYFFSFIAFGLLVTAILLRSRRSAHKGNNAMTAIAISLAFLSVFLINLIFRNQVHRADLTEDRLYTLSPSTEALLKRLPNNLNLRYYFSFSSPTASIQTKARARRIQDLLREIELHSDGKVNFKTLDPFSNPTALSSAKLDGIKPLFSRPGRELYSGLAIAYLDQVISLPQIDGHIEEQLEFQFSRTIRQILEPKKFIAIKTSLPILGLEPDLKAGRVQKENEWMFVNELRREYDVRELPDNINPTVLDPAKVAAILLIHPEPLSEKLMFALDQYLLKGGKLFCFLDSVSLMQARAKVSNHLSSDLFGFSETWGVRYLNKRLLADMDLAQAVQARPSPFMLQLTPDNSKSELKTFKSFKKLFFPHVGIIDYQKKEKLVYEELLVSSQNSMEVNTKYAGNVPYVSKNFKANDNTYPLAIKVSGDFDSAFASIPPSFEVPAYLKKSSKKGEAYIFADSDFLHESFMINMQVLPDGSKKKVNISDNLEFFMNFMDETLYDGVLIDLRYRRQQRRKLDKVNTLKQDDINSRQAEIDEIKSKKALAQFTVKKVKNKMARQIPLSLAEQESLRKGETELEEADASMDIIVAEIDANANDFKNFIIGLNIIIPPLLVILLLITRLVLARIRRKSA